MEGRGFYGGVTGLRFIRVLKRGGRLSWNGDCLGRGCGGGGTEFLFERIGRLVRRRAGGIRSFFFFVRFFVSVFRWLSLVRRESGRCSE